LASSGGHDVAFDGRKVFPLRLLLRHYPFRGQAHARRKIFDERCPRFRPAERAMGWHVQYDDVTPDTRFVRDPETLTEYDPALVRLSLYLSSRTVEELRASLDARDTDLHVQNADLHVQNAGLRNRVTAQQSELARVSTELEVTRRHLDSVLAARTWRLTAPLRHISEWVRGGPKGP
jgi:hypothetical protein